MTVAGYDLGHRGTVEAEHWLASLLSAAEGSPVACTHLVHGPDPRVVVTISGGAPPVAPSSTEAAAAAVADHAAGLAGRAVLFPGVRSLTGILPVATLLSESAIDEVVVLGGPPCEPDSRIDTRDFVRPQYRDGRLVLMATPAPGGLIAPFEVPNPTPCCANH
ncbi:hypothetical protein [Actinoplanes subtropicus]|uniref:hypothetical protein n=1 Tax=Actinoplanes subtropicus TaxID=543632 RepID=UPI0004C316E4|nr:hypothetical protein [Actinoplanes subtropicus]